MLVVGAICNVLGLFQWFIDTSIWPLGHKLMVLFGILLITLFFNYAYYGEFIPKELKSIRELRIRIAIIVVYLLVLIGFLIFCISPKLYAKPESASSASPSQTYEMTPNSTTPLQTDTPAPVFSPTSALTSESITTTPPSTPTPFILISGTYDTGIGEPDSYRKGMTAHDKEDYKTAFPYILEAAERGYAPAQYQLGNYYHHGLGTKVNVEKAYFWYKQSADQYYSNGLLWTGYCYQYGVGIEQDYTIAEAYYLAAQEAGHPNADKRLGELYQVMGK